VIAANLEVKARDPEAWAVLLRHEWQFGRGHGEQSPRLQSVNDVRVGSAHSRPITRQLSDAYCRFVDFDFVGQ
jgi:hypothetical protein